MSCHYSHPSWKRHGRLAVTTVDAMAVSFHFVKDNWLLKVGDRIGERGSPEITGLGDLWTNQCNLPHITVP
jgi:hypothetical protein